MPQNKRYNILLPKSTKHLKEFQKLLKRRKSQTEKAIEKLKIAPTDLRNRAIEKLQNSNAGTYSIRISKGDRIAYDVNEKKKEVLLVRAGKHDDVYGLG